MGIAVVLNLDNKLLKKVYDAQEILLNELEIKHQIINQSHPHINIFSGDIKDSFLDEFINTIKDFNKTNNKIKYKINSNGLGVFVFDNPVIYVRYKNSHIFDKLRSFLFKKNIYWKNLDKTIKRDLWLPKTTIAHKDTNIKNLSSALKYIQHLNFVDSIEFKKLSLIEYSVNTPEKSLL